MNETRYRSLVKGLSWRLVGTADTTVLSWVFTRAIGKALQIGGVECFTKLLLYYLHERVWVSVPWARQIVEEHGVRVPKDEHRRSLAKGISWRITGTVDTIVIALFITGEYTKALSIGATEVVTKILLYYLHERIWLRLSLGRHGGEQTA